MEVWVVVQADRWLRWLWQVLAASPW